MSKFNLIALAIAASLAAPAAMALEVTPAASQLRIANVDVEDATTPVHVGGLKIAIANQDLIIGRTVGFSVRIDLQDGAKFSSNIGALPAVGAALGQAATATTYVPCDSATNDIDANGNPSVGCTPGNPSSNVLVPGTNDTRWTVSLAAGGQANDSFAVYSVQPGTHSVGVINGDALTFAASNIVLKNVAGLGTAGASVSAKISFADPGTAQTILDPVTKAIVTSVNPLNYTVAGSIGFDNVRVDVGTSGGAVSTKTRFSTNVANGNINTATASSRTFAAGELTVGVPATGAPRAVAAPATAFSWAATDTVTLSVAGNLSAFKNVATPTANNANVLLTTSSSCATTSSNPTAGITGGVGAVTATGATFGAVTYNNLATGKATLCLVAPTDNVVIDASDLGTSVVVKRASTGKTVSASAAASALEYNGPVVDVDHFNPASNVTQVSYLRIINPSSLDGLVSIASVCDDGTEQAPVTMTLGAGKAVLLTSNDLATGAKGLSGSLTQCTTGKSRLTVTGEFNGMKVQNFLRNWTNDGSQINTNVNNQN